MNAHFIVRVLRWASRLLIIGIAFMVLFFSAPFQAMSASQMQANNDEEEVIELLHLRVPKAFREDWLKSEKVSWGPWLAQQEGFLGRQLLWDKEREEAVLLIRWESREHWKGIPQAEVDAAQQLFEKFAREATGQVSGNPFPLIYEAELLVFQ